MKLKISNLSTISAFYGNYAIYTDTMGKSGIINRQGEIVFWADEFEIATHVEKNTFAFQNTDGSRKELLFDAATGEKKYFERPAVEHLPMEQNFLVAPNRIAFQEEGLFGIKDEKGNVVVPAQYTQMSSIGENIGLIHVKDKDNRAGIITADGKPFIKCKYAYVVHKRTTDTYKVKTLKGKFGLLDSKGKVLVPARYDYLDVTDNLDEIAVKRGGRCFFINRNGKPIDLIEAWENHLIEQFSSKSGYRLTKNDKNGRIYFVKENKIVKEATYKDLCTILEQMLKTINELK